MATNTAIQNRITGHLQMTQPARRFWPANSVVQSFFCTDSAYRVEVRNHGKRWSRALERPPAAARRGQREDSLVSAAIVANPENACRLQPRSKPRRSSFPCFPRLDRFVSPKQGFGA